MPTPNPQPQHKANRARGGRWHFWVPLAVMVLGTGCNTRVGANTPFCFGDGTCVNRDGDLVFEDGTRVCERDNTCPDSPVVPPVVEEPPPLGNVPVRPTCTCDMQGPDQDGDGISDACEDKNSNRQVDVGESAFNDADSDNDGILDGLEDSNHDGCFQFGETHPLKVDTDGDRIADGIEDANRNGVVDVWTDTNGDGCFNGNDIAGELNPRVADSDRDGIADGVEDNLALVNRPTNLNGRYDPPETQGFAPDTDCDGLLDGREDLNHNGIVNSNETSPLVYDTDGDGLRDGLEDRNGNGRWEEGTETSALLVDSDSDGINDNVEDRNLNGVVDAFVDSNGDGCWTLGEYGETDPRRPDSDGDGLLDRLEDINGNGVCDAVLLPHPLTSQLVATYLETCGFHRDTDCDGLADGQEDVNKNGSYDLSETNPRLFDSDFDMLSDGCPAGAAQSTCEDKDNSGTKHASETDPRIADTDGDGLSDGCEIAFVGGPTNPLMADTDDDGDDDGAEDLNRNCRFEPNLNETDPRQASTPPPLGAESYPEWKVCATRNLKRLTYAASARTTHDYRLSLKMETREDGHCTLDKDCAGQEICDLNTCVLPYAVQTFGHAKAATDLFDPNDESQPLLGHVFQSPRALSGSNRDIYGFVLAHPDSRSLDSVLDDVRDDLSTTFSSMTEDAASLARPAHDDSGTAYPVERAERRFTVRLTALESSVVVRNNLLNMMLHRLPEATSFSSVEFSAYRPEADHVYGAVSCSRDPALCTTTFNVNVSAVRRHLQIGASGGPLVLFTVALTPGLANVEASSEAQRNAHADRLTDLEDLTGGSSLARYAAETTKSCEVKDRTLAKADLLWVMDDSGSMQRLLHKLQLAARDAKAALTANSQIVDFRVAMTTTNASAGARTECFSGCESDCTGILPQNDSVCTGSCADQTLGCIDQAGVSDPTARRAAILNDFKTEPLPGGGGTFYYEDSGLLDCDSSVQTGAIAFINACSPHSPLFDPFFVDERLEDNAGFLSSVSNATCTTSLMNLRYVIDSSTTCVNSSQCCERLLSSCGDGPTVLASQICDLMRAMGGLPKGGANDETGGRRRHSAPEHGSRSVRRLLSTLLPAVREENPNAALHKERLRWSGCIATPQSCSVDAQCQNGERCLEGTCYSGCRAVPLVSIVLSDEEDFWFKDDCAPDASSADLWQLEESCYHMPGSLGVARPCTPEYCACNGYNPQASLTCPPGSPTCTAGNCPTDKPTGYDPDLAAWTSNAATSLKWRDSNANQCSAQSSTPCGRDPCDTLLNQTDCGNAPASLSCVWNSGRCRNSCAANHLTKTSCEQNTSCRWIKGLANHTDTNIRACTRKIPLNDCQACKRLRRLKETLDGATADTGLVRTPSVYGNAGTLQFATPALPGVRASLGPVYAIVRNKGTQGYKDGVIEDACAGGPTTWGRGDGQAYRDLALHTYGRTQDICAESYRSFMQHVITDIVALSAPYKLAGSPLAATLKVGISRQQPNGTFAFIDVPRSRTRGFIYDATSQSVGFKSDPIDGSCGGGACTLNGTIEPSEIEYARTSPHVPLPGDKIYISYRSWSQVPCQQPCAEGQTCARVVCTAPALPGVCQNGDDSTCYPGHSCQANQCVRTCQLGSLIDACVSAPSCSVCETYDLQSDTCDPIADTCVCDGRPDIQRCLQGGANTCPTGQYCSGCACTRVPACHGDPALFLNDSGEVSDPDAALTCCRDVDAAAIACAGITLAGACTGDCAWTSATSTCAYKYPTCCGPDETPSHYEDPQTGKSYFFCNASCQCSGVDCTGNPNVCASWQTCDATTRRCTPACHPTSEYCCQDCVGDAACTCQPLPN